MIAYVLRADARLTLWALNKVTNSWAYRAAAAIAVFAGLSLILVNLAVVPSAMKIIPPT